jgi:uncharacterized protein (DUF2384 family)
MTWALPVTELGLRDPEAFSDLIPLLERLDRGFGTRGAARLLGVEPGTVTNWKRRRHVISHEYARRLIDLHDVLMRAFRVYGPIVAQDWLLGSEPFLGGARPIDVLALRGAAPLIEVLDAVEAGAFA